MTEIFKSSSSIRGDLIIEVIVMHLCHLRVMLI